MYVWNLLRRPGHINIHQGGVWRSRRNPSCNDTPLNTTIKSKNTGRVSRCHNNTGTNVLCACARTCVRVCVYEHMCERVRGRDVAEVPTSHEQRSE